MTSGFLISLIRNMLITSNKRFIKYSIPLYDDIKGTFSHVKINHDEIVVVFIKPQEPQEPQEPQQLK